MGMGCAVVMAEVKRGNRASVWLLAHLPFVYHHPYVVIGVVAFIVGLVVTIIQG